jgi:Recombinase
VSKRRGAADGSPYGGQRFSRGALYLMLKNPLYRGQTVHKDKTFPGEHAAIVDEERWAKVQRRCRHTGRIGVGILGAIPNPGNTTVCRRRNGGARFRHGISNFNGLSHS